MSIGELYLFLAYDADVVLILPVSGSVNTGQHTQCRTLEPHSGLCGTRKVAVQIAVIYAQLIVVTLYKANAQRIRAFRVATVASRVRDISDLAVGRDRELCIIFIVEHEQMSPVKKTLKQVQPTQS